MVVDEGTVQMVYSAHVVRRPDEERRMKNTKNSMRSDRSSPHYRVIRDFFAVEHRLRYIGSPPIIVCIWFVFVALCRNGYALRIYCISCICYTHFIEHLSLTPGYWTRALCVSIRWLLPCSEKW